MPLQLRDSSEACNQVLQSPHNPIEQLIHQLRYLSFGNIDLVPVAFATKFQNAGKDVDFLLAWNRPHSGDYALDELFAWIASITK